MSCKFKIVVAACAARAVAVGMDGLLLRRLSRRWAIALLVIMAFPLAASASPYTSFNFSDIDYWVGTGSNEAALVVDFKTSSGDASYAWGYKWDGTATGEDMFRAIAGTTVLRQRDGGPFLGTFAGSDARLYLRSSAFGSGLGNSIFGIGYDLDGDGGSFVSGYEGNEIGYATDSDDFYREGWFTGYWSYWISEPTAPAWGYSGLGFSSRQLTDGSWDGWSYADFNTGDFGEPAIPMAAQVPEPATIVVLTMGGLAMLCYRRSRMNVRLSVIAAVALLGIQTESHAVGIYDYQYQRSFTLPAPTVDFSSVLFDALPDGRLLLLNNATVSIETAPKSASFVVLGDISGFSPLSGPSFLAISPDGTRAAAGSNGGGSVVVFNTGNPASSTSYAAADFGAEWLDNNRLAISSGFGTAKVEILDTATSTVTPVVTNIVGAAGGVSFDTAGNLYVGNGYGSNVGVIKSFAAADWQSALATSTPLNFATQGTPIADLLSAYPVGFDATGNMFVGGGDFFGNSDDIGYAALVDVSAVVDALANPQATPPITASSSASVLRKFISPPDTIDGDQPPNWLYNAATGELYLNYVYDSSGVVSVYVAVPEPSCFALLVMCSMLIVARPGRKSYW